LARPTPVSLMGHTRDIRDGKGTSAWELNDLTRFTDGSIASRQAALPGPLRDLHRAVLRRFLETGSAPTRRWVRQAALDAGLDASAVDELAAADAVHIANGLVTVAYPFSGTPTPHRVELDGLPAVYAMCAMDALGLPVMAGGTGRSPPPTRVTVRPSR
jgi:hypothetical protein